MRYYTVLQNLSVLNNHQTFTNVVLQETHLICSENLYNNTSTYKFLQQRSEKVKIGNRSISASVVINKKSAHLKTAERCAPTN